MLSIHIVHYSQLYNNSNMAALHMTIRFSRRENLNDALYFVIPEEKFV